jgi:O-antigen/teichoic acid export membrane protein
MFCVSFTWEFLSMAENRSSKIKKSIVLSGLIGTGGLFIAKVLGLVYSIPFSRILSSDAYMSYYGAAFNIYSYVLNIFTAGFPFAIATLVARYGIKGDYKAMHHVKRMAVRTMAMGGFLGMVLMMLFAGLITPAAHPEAGDEGIMTTTLRILSLAIFIVPIVSVYRGFYEGRKEMQEYAFSQAFEQFIRVAFLLTFASIAVYVLDMSRVWALYIAVLSTSVSALAALVQLVRFDHRKRPEIVDGMKKQKVRTVRQRVIFREFIHLAIPYLVVAVLGYSTELFYTLLLPAGLSAHGYSEATASVIKSAFNYSGSKLTSIPMILAPGFTAALIPHISEAIAVHDDSKVVRNITDCLNIIFYIGLPAAFCLFLYAEGAYHILFFTEDLATASGVVKWLAIEGFLGTLTPVVTNIMMALERQKHVLKRLALSTVLTGALMVPLTWAFGYAGAVMASACGYLVLILLNIREIHHAYPIRFRSIASVAVRTCIGLAAMFAVSTLLDHLGLAGTDPSRAVALIKLLINVIVTFAVYFLITSALRVPDTIFRRPILAVMKEKLSRRKS